MRSAWDVISDDAPGARSSSASSPRWRSAWPRRAGIPARSQEQQHDGSLLWRARVSGVLEIRSWILGWGADAEVLEPAELREWVAARHAEAAARYRATGTAEPLSAASGATAP